MKLNITIPKLQSLSLMAVLKWDLDIVDLPDVLKQEVEAIQDLMGSYIVNGVKMVVKKRDGGEISLANVRTFVKELLQDNDLILEFGQRVVVNASHFGGHTYFFLAAGEPLATFRSFVWDMKAMRYFNHQPSTTDDHILGLGLTNVKRRGIIVENCEGGKLYRCEFVKWRIPGQENFRVCEIVSEIWMDEDGFLVFKQQVPIYWGWGRLELNVTIDYIARKFN